MRRFYARACGLAVTAIFLGGLAVAEPAAAANSYKPYSIVICTTDETCTPSQPAVVAPGSAPGTTPTPATMTATLKNENPGGSTIALGSANLTAPSGFVVAGTTLPPCTALSTTACATIASGGSVVQLRNLGLAPGASQTVSMTVDTPAPPSTCTRTSPCHWGVQAKQANNFNGTGNDLNEDPATSQDGTVVSDTTYCSEGAPCSTTLADGGTSSSAASSISATIAADSGAAATLTEALDYGKPFACTQAPEPGHHSVFWDLNATSGATTTNRRVTLSITTTVAGFTGYQSEMCLVAPFPFTQKVVVSSPAGIALLPADTYGPVGPDGSASPTGSWYIGVLPDCGSTPLIQVDPAKEPCVDRSQTNNNGVTATTVATIPAGEPGDPWSYN
jgi:hypothetical protein